jgi:hypothetical protein
LVNICKSRGASYPRRSEYLHVRTLITCCRVQNGLFCCFADVMLTFIWNKYRWKSTHVFGLLYELVGFFMFDCVCLTTFHVIRNMFQLCVSWLTFELNFCLVAEIDLYKMTELSKVSSANCKEGLWN